MPVVDDLREAKGHSDAARYDQKNRILRALIRAYPSEFAVDSDDGRGIVGVTHLPSGFRIHMRSHQAPVRQMVRVGAIPAGPVS